MSDLSKKRILILDGQAVQTLIVAKQLISHNYEVYLLCDDKWTYGYHTRYAHRAVIAPSIHDYETYKRYLIRFISENKIDVLIPMTDESARFLSLEKAVLLPLVSYIMPDISVFERGYDKQQLMALCAANSYPHPQTIDLEADLGAVARFAYPALIKPNHMTGGRGMTVVNSFEEFNKIYPAIRETYGPCHLQEFIPEGGRQLKVQLFISFNGQVVASSVIHKQRFYPENGGSSCCNVTIKDDTLIKLCADVLKKIGWIGFADFDLIEDPRDEVIKIMELNPRIPACIKSAIESGADYATLIADASLGLPLVYSNYIPGHQLRHIGFEVLWFIYSANRFKTAPNWFRFWGRNLSFQDFSWSDPMPFFFGTIGNLKKQLNPKFRKAKSGLR